MLLFGLIGLILGIWGLIRKPKSGGTPTVSIIAAGFGLLAIVLGLLVHAFMYAGQPAIMAEMFPTRMRYSGVSLGYQVTSIVAGSLAPIIATFLLRQYDSSVPVSVYLLGASVVTIVAVWFTRETKGTSLHDVDRADAEAHRTEAVVS